MVDPRHQDLSATAWLLVLGVGLILLGILVPLLFAVSANVGPTGRVYELETVFRAQLVSTLLGLVLIAFAALAYRLNIGSQEAPKRRIT